MRYTKVLDFNTVELGCQLAQALIAALPHILDDFGRNLQGLCIEGALSLQVRIVEYLAWFKYDSAHVDPFV